MADFMDKLKTGFNKGVATVSTGSKNMVEKTKINTAIKNLEAEIKELSSVMGIKLYNYCAQNTEGDIPREEFASFCNEISLRNEYIKQYQAKIVALDQEMELVKGNSSIISGNGGLTCSCGTINAPDAKFCASCGAPLR